MEMKVILKYAGIVHEITGKLSEEIEIGAETSLSDILRRLTLQYGLRFKEHVFDYEANKPAPQILILLNGKIIQDYDRKINDGDFVSIIPMVSGG
jgi:MoaD family protein